MSNIDFEVWLNHFEYHAQHPRCVPEGLGDRLTCDERQLIAGSMATFQLGEQSDGRRLMRSAEQFARAQGVPGVARIVALFVREEQRHAELLRLFMLDHGIALKKADATDKVFRAVRHLAGLELCLYVLLSAELIGIVYYRALGGVTGCERLKVICRMLVADELAHVGFESQLLLAFKARRPAWLGSLLHKVHRVFMAGVAAAVWFAHRRVLHRAGYRMWSFLRACLSQQVFYLGAVTVDPHAMASAQTPPIELGSGSR